MDVYVKGKRIQLLASQSIGKGGEADVFGLGATAFKVFKAPQHPDFQGLPDEQLIARERIKEHQKKLPLFPRNLPSHVVTPVDLAYDKDKQIIGYTMHYIPKAIELRQYSEQTFRQKGIKQEDVTAVFRDLHRTVGQIHTAGVVIGDFNDLNVIVKNNEAYIVDADSFQFGQFYCRAFTERFVDPLVCNPRATKLILQKPYRSESDWYAFAVMLIECLLCTEPYGGVYIPKRKASMIPHDARPLYRITVFHPDVRYPKPAIPYIVLPDDLLQHFHNVFEKDLRSAFPFILLEQLRWTKCTGCGKEHGRSVCPFCKHVAPAAVKAVVTIRGSVKATRIFQSSGIIVFAKSQDGELVWVYHENGSFKREDGSLVAQGKLDPAMRLSIRGKQTLIGRRNHLVMFDPMAGTKNAISVDTHLDWPCFDANADRRFWLANGKLIGDGKLGPDYPETIGDVLTGQTQFWVGTQFGFGLYRAGNICQAFVFDCHRRGINDSVTMPPIRGQLIDATCSFSRDLCWFFTTTQEKGKTMNHCMVIRASGVHEATGDAPYGNGSWLGTINGKCAVGTSLLSATDEGIVRVELQNGRIVEGAKFPDTEPFVHAASRLFVSKEGLMVVNEHDITALQIT